MTLEVIGAGFGRTGTLSLKRALERLGFGPCYHGSEVLSNPTRSVHWQDSILDWNTIFAGFRATVDWPAASYWNELAHHFSQAKIVLSIRDVDKWYESMMNTLHPSLIQGPPKSADPNLHEFHEMLSKLILESTFEGRLTDENHAKKVFVQHTESVIQEIDDSRLLVFQPSDGWTSLCDFLEVDVPNEDFPHVNDTAWYQAQTRRRRGQ